MNNSIFAGLEGLGRQPLVVTETRWEKRGIDPVSNSIELQRIITIPRRVDAQIETQILTVQKQVTRPNAKMTLRPIQARALAEASLAQGLFAPIPVGQGKTLTAALLPTVMHKARAVILTNAGLVAQAIHLMREYAEHFYVRRDIRWLSYGVLSSPTQFEILDRLNPELIIADESQALANAMAARTKRFNRFLKSHPETIFCAMSGTITKRSIKDYAHQLHLALKDRTPLPRDWKSLTEWAEAVDVSDRPRPPGALVELMTDDHAAQWLHTHNPNAIHRGRMYLRGAAQRQPDPDSDEGATIQELARECLRKRMLETVGVVGADHNDLEAELQISVIEAPPDEAIKEALKEVYRLWKRPDGELLTWGLEVARVTKHMRQGGYYRWVWPEKVLEDDRLRWLMVRAEWRKALREFLKHNSRVGLDSPFLVENALRRGERIKNLVGDAFTPWEIVRREIEQPPTEWVWISRAIAEYACVWAEQAGPSIIWADTVAVGQEIARVLKAPWYGAGQDAQTGILEEKGNRVVVASIKAHGTGRNLQCYNRALVIGGPSQGATWEQLLGRLHRSGQEAEIVGFSILDSFKGELETAIRDAKFIEHTTGTHQKLLRATYLEVDAV